MLPHGVSSEQPLLCDPKDVGTPTVRVDSFSSNIYTGSQFEALINALHVAACCARTPPRIGTLRRSSCLAF